MIQRRKPRTLQAKLVRLLQKQREINLDVRMTRKKIQLANREVK